MRLFCNTGHWSIHALHGLHSMYQMKLKSACPQTRSYKFSYISGFTTLCCRSITQDISKPCCKKELEKTLLLTHALLNIPALILKQILCLQWQVRHEDFGRCRISIPLNTNPQSTTKQTLSNKICYNIVAQENSGSHLSSSLIGYAGSLTTEQLNSKKKKTRKPTDISTFFWNLERDFN